MDYTIDKFHNKYEYNEYLKFLFLRLSKMGVFNIYTHIISDHSYGLNRSDLNNVQERINNKLDGILSSKLSLDKYSSINGTMRLQGNTCDIDSLVKKVIDYNYDHMKIRTACIIAFPKYIAIEGKQIEYSSYDGESIEANPEKLIKKYKEKVYLTPSKDHFKFCLFDAIKEYDGLPKEYLLGVQRIDEDNNYFSFLNPLTHLLQIPQEKADEHLSLVNEKVRKKIEKYGTYDLDDIIINSYKDNQKWYEYVDDFDI